MDQPLWMPTHQRITQTKLAAYRRYIQETYGVETCTMQELHTWSIQNIEAFWQSVWDFCGVIASQKATKVFWPGKTMRESQFFADARLNYAQNLLRRRDETLALIFWGEDKLKRHLSYRELYRRVSEMTQALRRAGIQEGDRVAGFVPNGPEALIAFLATAALGAVWSSCSPDFGVQGVLDRFGQIEPKILVSTDGYYYGGRWFSNVEKLQEVVAGIPSICHFVIAPYDGVSEIQGDFGEHFVSWVDFVRDSDPDQEIDFQQVSFNAPLYILFSSGTTGSPKCIVHGVGGTLIQHLKEHQLHTDVRSGDRVFYFTTCGWMMWNWQVSALASGATLMVYDGSPFYPNGNILFDFAQAEGFTLFGTSAKYIDALEKEGLNPKKTHNLSNLRTITSTGSPLSPESFRYVYQSIKEDVCLSSISGGTDIVSCFALGDPTGAVWAGELQTRGLGMDVRVLNEEGHEVRSEKGELTCAKPFPSQPIYFWNDPDGEKFREAYFETDDHVWRHGDYVELTDHRGMIFYGRSDAVLNPGGVRIGTAEIYRQVQTIPEVLESIAVGQEWAGDVRVILFVKLREGVVLTDDLIGYIKHTIRQNTTPRHVPAKVVAIGDIPRTKSGKIVELAVRDIIHNRPIKNREALANPEALELYVNVAELMY